MKPRSLRKNLILILSVFFVSMLLAQEKTSLNKHALVKNVNVDEPIKKNIAEFSINSALNTALQLSEINAELANKKLIQLLAEITSYNDAELYLLALTQANIAKKNTNYKLVIKLLTESSKLEDNISTEQLDQPTFFKQKLLLAQSYAVEGDFEQAFKFKKAYLKKFKSHYKNKNKQMVVQLNKKYQTAHKIKENELLRQQNEMEQIKIAEAEQQQRQSERNLIILAFISLIFSLMMLRQFLVRAKLTRLTRIDSLTGLTNRKSLFHLGHKLTEKAVEQDSTFSAILFDNDFFKQINDTYGHQVGDQVLIKIADIGKDVVRSRDVFARIGGEEFVVLLPEENLAEAKAVAEHLKEKIARYDFSPFGIEMPVTASFGVASLHQVGANFDQLLHAADVAMYQAKLQGRNKVVCFEQSAELSSKQMIKSNIRKH